MLGVITSLFFSDGAVLFFPEQTDSHQTGLLRL